MRILEKLVFAAAVALFVFLGGIVVGKYQYWPYDHLKRAKDAAKALWVAYFPAERPVFAQSVQARAASPAGTRGATAGRLTFLPMFTTTAPAPSCSTWRARSCIAGRSPSAASFRRRAAHLRTGAGRPLGWHGMHLYPNGDLLLNFEGGGFPAAAGWC